MGSEKSDLLQGTLDMLVLKIVALEPAHGYGIAHRIQQISRAVLQVQQGSLYPALHRLEKRGWLKADWRPSETGREAKFYSLTRAGRKRLEAKTAIFSLIDAVMLRPLPAVRAPEQLVQLARLSERGYPNPLSYPLFEYFRDRLSTVSATFVEMPIRHDITIAGVDEMVNGDEVS